MKPNSKGNIILNKLSHISFTWYNKKIIKAITTKLINLLFLITYYPPNIIVTGPSLVILTVISAPKIPVFTGIS